MAELQKERVAGKERAGLRSGILEGGGGEELEKEKFPWVKKGGQAMGGGEGDRKERPQKGKNVYAMWTARKGAAVGQKKKTKGINALEKETQANGQAENFRPIKSQESAHQRH